ncbi:hypothetical protein ACOAOT_23990 [Lacrimispora sp. AGF001]|uniref:hypothetical protein n=1 Tax=Lacrimispora sp. AGF001 TaxID=3401631 RepID=UPI003B43B6F9
MKAKCELAPDINKCPHYDPVEQECNSNNECCGFYRKPGTESIPQYFRQPRWYEQYYKKH